jgi:NAD(P)-dependent dehydrogenase (short-subunit alcohol dehydrogenase family)
VLIVARDPARGEAARRDVEAATGRTIEVLGADLSLMADVRRVAGEVRSRRDRLHGLVNNAGAMHTRRKVTAEGLEMTFAVNHLAYFLLVRELLPLLEASGTAERKARIINVASTAHRRARLDLDDLQLERRPYGPALQQYSNTKLMNILFTYELARRLEGKPVTANCLHPGVVATGFGHNDRGLMHLAISIAAPFFLSPERGARTQLYLATSPEVEGVSGRYFARSREAQSRRASLDRETQRRLWEQSETLT